MFALKWSDISEDLKSIRIRRQLLREPEMNGNKWKYVWKFEEFVKGKTKNGFRDMPLTSESWKILQRIKEVNPDSEYLFVTKEGELLYPDSFNEKLKDNCDEIGIEYFSSHKI